MTDFKKGGPLQNSNIYATNRLFVKNPLFKKRKKKRAPGVYNPKAKFKYEKGGEQGCPPGQQWNPYTKRCEPKLEDRTFLNLMRDRKYGALQQFKLAPKSSYNPKYIQNLKEVTITASKKAKAKKNKKKTDTFSSDYEKLVEQYDKLKNSPLLANQEQANNLLNQIKDIELYNPGSTGKNLYRGKRLEDQINNLLDKAQDKASISANAITEDGNDEIDNFRHPQAGRYAAEAIVNYFPEWAQYTGIPQIAGFLGANAMGVAHEIGTLPYDERSWSTKLAESGEDIFNNAVGAGVGVLPMSSRDKTNALLELSKQNMLPDGIVDENPANNLYLKKGPNDPGKFKSPYKQELGGSIVDLTEEEIQKYIDGGYVVEEVNDPSIPALTKAAKGGATDEYIEVDIPEEEIQWYIDNGYRVERVSKLNKFIQGGSPSEIWVQYTGTPWSEAKKQGLTDGTMDQNLALVKRLEAGEFGEPKIVDTKPTPTVTSYDKMVFALVKQGNSLDDLVKQKIGTREGLIFKYPELFANKKNVSAPKKSGPKPKKGTTIMEQFDALSKFASPYIDKVGDAVSTAYDSWINRMSKISEQEKKAEQLKKFTKPTGNQKQVIQPYDIEALKAQLTQSNAAGAPPSLTRQPSQQPLGDNSFAAQFAEYGQRGQGIEMNPLKNVTDNNVTLPVINNKTKEEPFSNQRFATPDIEKEIFTRQEQDNMKYGKFMGRGKNIANRTDVQRNVDSEKFFADIASPNSVIIDIGSALGNTDPKLAGVSVWELTQNPKIKQKKIKVIATDIPEQVNTFKQHSKDKKAYNIDYAEVPMTFNTPVDTILKSKNLTNTKDIYLRAANSIDLLMTPIQTKEHFDYIAKTLKNKNVTYVFNNIILFKPAGKSTFTKLGNINNAAYDHNAASWTVNKDRKPYKLLGKE